MIKLIKMTRDLNEAVHKSEKSRIPDGQYYGEFSNIVFVEVDGCIYAALAEFRIFLKYDQPIVNYQMIPLEEWFQSEEINFLDGLRSFARANHIGLSEMVGTIGRITVKTKKETSNREISRVTDYIPEFDEAFVISA
ncbi:hypothetical protein GH811_02690 [Acetobacterium malicum]|uniref:Uncharacterized protein n=1 Tax=Acetobacterium malicum TaxID=52692 RepID=A0ABR6YTM5_9FIRM|nr:hypothetical protein [Acetobacterium malicum]MBC3898524.1 hypothetical protein [Acetobacterium malicum]